MWGLAFGFGVCGLGMLGLGGWGVEFGLDFRFFKWFGFGMLRSVFFGGWSFGMAFGSVWFADFAWKSRYFLKTLRVMVGLVCFGYVWVLFFDVLWFRRVRTYFDRQFFFLKKNT